MKNFNTIAYKLLVAVLFMGTAGSLFCTISCALRMKSVSDLNFDTPLCFTLILFIAFMMIAGKDKKKLTAAE
ncbi:MAG: hypothetical protein J5501_10500 [Ruminococcus sp.]|nr:hypothetical protein [Ruminococcus sp.]